MHLCTASRFRFCFLSCKSFNPENPDSDNKDALLNINKQIQFPFGIYREACDNLALVLIFQGSEDSHNRTGADMKNFSIFSRYPFWILGLILLCSCDLIQELIQPPSEMETAPIRVAMIYPDDCVGDSGYCDTLHFGVKRAEAELGIHLNEVIGMESDPVVTEMLFREAAQNSDLIITAGFQMGEPLSRVASDFPDVKFAIVDVALDLPNVAGLNYKANEGSFLVGAIAGLKLESGKVGYIGGVDVPLLREFEAGYVAGVHAVNPDAVVSIEYISDGYRRFQPAGQGERDRVNPI